MLEHRQYRLVSDEKSGPPAPTETGAPGTVSAVRKMLPRFAVRIPRGITRRRLACPLLARDATVDFVVEDDGGDTCADVVACSLVPGGCEIACGKPCRSIGVAPFGY